MKIVRPIHTEDEYDKALVRVDEIFDAKKGTKEGDELELLLILIEKYEDEHHPVPLPDPIEAIKYRMEELGLKDKDLVPYIGNKGNVSKILNRQRKLTADMMRALHKYLGVPAESLLA